MRGVNHVKLHCCIRLSERLLQTFSGGVNEFFTVYPKSGGLCIYVSPIHHYTHLQQRIHPSSKWECKESTQFRKTRIHPQSRVNYQSRSITLLIDYICVLKTKRASQGCQLLINKPFVIVVISMRVANQFSVSRT